MPIRRTSTKSSQVTGFYSPETFRVVGSGRVDPFDPASLLPLFWYDFSDQSTVTESAGRISQITDKGSANRTLTVNGIDTLPTYSTTINGQKVSDWGTLNHSNSLRSTDATSYTMGDLYAVVDSTDTGNFPNYSAIATEPGGGLGIYLNGSNTGFEGPYGFINNVFVNGGSTNRYTNVFPEIASPCILRATNSGASTSSSTGGFQLGMDRTNGTRGWRGLIGEVMCFSSKLNDTNASDLIIWLSSKWNISLG